MKRVKIDISTLSIDELKKVYFNCVEAHENCGNCKCSDCYTDSGNFVGLDNLGCCSIRDSIGYLVKFLERKEEGKEPQKYSGCSKCSGNCESCKRIDSEFYENSGYLFYSHWHNFTVKDGFCYAFEGVENS